jgi:segregation and condensation protein B
MNDGTSLKTILEAALLAAGRPLDGDALAALFDEAAQPDPAALRDALEELARDYEGRGIEVREVSSGWRIQVRASFAPWVSRLWEEKPGRYSRALMETLAIIAYRQPITRGEIEDIRGVAVSTNIVKTLLEREWVRVVGQRDVPGRPSLYATTRQFLDYFGLRSLEDLPPLAEIRDLVSIDGELDLAPEEEGAAIVATAGTDAVAEPVQPAGEGGAPEDVEAPGIPTDVAAEPQPADGDAAEDTESEPPRREGAD